MSIPSIKKILSRYIFGKVGIGQRSMIYISNESRNNIGLTDEVTFAICFVKIVKIKTEIETWLKDHPAVPATPIPPID